MEKQISKKETLINEINDLNNTIEEYRKQKKDDLLLRNKLVQLILELDLIERDR